jgi:hypothetical protein
MIEFECFDYLVIDCDENMLPDDSWFVSIQNLADWDKDEVLKWFPDKDAAIKYANDMKKETNILFNPSSTTIFSKKDIASEINRYINDIFEKNKLAYLLSIDNFSKLEKVEIMDIKTEKHIDNEDYVVYYIIPVWNVRFEEKTYTLESHFIYTNSTTVSNLFLPMEFLLNTVVITTKIDGKSIIEKSDIYNFEYLRTLIVSEKDICDRHDNIPPSKMLHEFIYEIKLWSTLKGKNDLYPHLYRIISS